MTWKHEKYYLLSAPIRTCRRYTWNIYNLRLKKPIIISSSPPIIDTMYIYLCMYVYSCHSFVSDGNLDLKQIFAEYGI